MEKASPGVPAGQGGQDADRAAGAKAPSSAQAEAPSSAQAEAPSSAQAEAPGSAESSPVLVLEHAAKSFGAVHALVDGSIELYPGEAHALVGENGAGKSTLVKILAGVYQPDAGTLLVNSEAVTLHSPAMARAAAGPCRVTSWPSTSNEPASG